MGIVVVVVSDRWLSVDRGTVYATGSNVNAQLGLGNQSPNVPTPTRVRHCHCLLCCYI